eukprot:115616-Pleurochrysis_carterae.AAC.1
MKASCLLGKGAETGIDGRMIDGGGKAINVKEVDEGRRWKSAEREGRAKRTRDALTGGARESTTQHYCLLRRIFINLTEKFGNHAYTMRVDSWI